MTERRLIIITGMPGAGKSEVAQVLHSEYGIPIIVMGDVIREEAIKRGMKPTPENTRKVMLELRQQNGPGAVAKRCIKHLVQTSSDVIVVEGCRSLSEIDVFNDYCSNLSIVCVHSSPATRFSRLCSRGREDAPPDFATFRERDLREISVGLGGVIALSDVMIVNEGTLEELHASIHEIAKRLVRYES